MWFKLDNCNPSGSYKDRFVAAEMTRLLRTGARACLATSSGNTGSALSAYCARYGLPCAIIVGERTPAGKLAQMRAHGALVVRVADFGSSPDVSDQVSAALCGLSRSEKVSMVASVVGVM